jgi:hypothetical protein
MVITLKSNITVAMKRYDGSSYFTSVNAFDGGIYKSDDSKIAFINGTAMRMERDGSVTVIGELEGTIEVKADFVVSVQ